MARDTSPQCKQCLDNSGSRADTRAQVEQARQRILVS